MTSKQRNMDTLSSSTVRFFKIITTQSLQAGKLRVPDGFTRKCGADMSNPFSLKTLDGKEWSIHWTKIDGYIWFQKGWKEFATHYSLGHGHMVLFEYDEKTTHFEVHIFDKSTLEIEYLVHGSQDEQNNPDKISDDSIEISDEVPKCKKTRPKSPKSCPQPHKKLRTNTSEDVGTSSKILNNIDQIRKKPVGPSSKKTRQKSQISRPQPRKKFRSDKSEDDGGRNSTIQKFPNHVRVKEEDADGSTKCLEVEQQEALNRAKNLRSENPSFIFVMKPCYLYNTFLHVPSQFANKYLKKGISDILLQVLDGRTWPSKYCLGRITKGWKKFVLDNNLEVGDVCVFELTNSQSLSFEVTIFRRGEQPCSPPRQDNPILSVQEQVTTLDPARIPDVESKTITTNKEDMGGTTECLKVKKERELLTFKIGEALQKAGNFRSNYHSFTVVMLSTNVNQHLYVPSKFAKKHFKEKQRDILLQILDERTWPVKYHLGRIDVGWKAFASDNNLKVGDVCRFELTKSEAVILKVIIFRLGEEPHSPPPQVQVDGVNQFDPANLLEVENKNIISGKGSKESRRNSLGTSPLSFTNDALIEAKRFTSENPFFRIMISLEPNHKPYVPKPFTRKYFEKNQIVMLKVQEKMWPVKLLWYPYKTSNNFSRGWPLFVQDSTLKTGDVCVFELTNRKDAVLDVHIFRSKSIMINKGRKETLRTSLQTRCDSFTNEALKEAKKFTSENPFFMVNIRPNRPGKKYSPHVPNPFIRNYMHSKTQIVKLQFDKKTWPVNCLFNPCKEQTGRLTSGWNLFAVENKLQAGDVCVFELIGKEDVVLDVHIFRGHS